MTYLPSVRYLHECFELKPNGVLLWRRRPDHHFKTVRSARCTRNRIVVGAVAGYKWSADGRRAVQLDGKNIKVSRIVYKMVTGVDPGRFLVDHINRDPSDDRPENLRLATHKINAHNSDQKPGKSGIWGLHWIASRKVWRAVVKNRCVAESEDRSKVLQVLREQKIVTWGKERNVCQ